MVGGNPAKTKPRLSSSFGFSELDLVRATFARRLVAAIVDAVIVWTIPLILIGNVTGPTVPPYEPANNGLAPILFAGTLVVLLLYNWLFTALRGQTLGKRLVKIKVVDVRGRRPRWGRALWRETAGRIVLLVSSAVSALSYLFSYMSAYSMDTTAVNSYPERAYRKPVDREPLDVFGFYERFTGTYVVRIERNRPS
jgi:uncharacterized RDD family membrane protein YckC